MDGPLGSDAYVWGWLAVHFGADALRYGAVLALGARHRLGHFLVHVLAGLLLVLDVKFPAAQVLCFIHLKVHIPVVM